LLSDAFSYCFVESDRIYSVIAVLMFFTCHKLEYHAVEKKEYNIIKAINSSIASVF